MEKKLAATRVLGRDRHGREVLVAAPGQPIDNKRFKVEGSPKTTSSESATAGDGAGKGDKPRRSSRKAD